MYMWIPGMVMGMPQSSSVHLVVDDSEEEQRQRLVQ